MACFKPGLAASGRTFASIEELAGLHVDAIRGVQSEGPYMLAGHSFGGAVAFDMARQLRDVGARVALVAILDLERPRRTSPAERDEASWIADIAGAVAAFLGRSLSVDPNDLRRLAPERRHVFLLDHLIRAGVVPPLPAARQDTPAQNQQC